MPDSSDAHGSAGGRELANPKAGKKSVMKKSEPSVILWNEALFMKTKETPFVGVKCLKVTYFVKGECAP